jgi:hypothetical protein
MGKLTIVQHPPGDPSPFARAMIFLPGKWPSQPGTTSAASKEAPPDDTSTSTPAAPSSRPTNAGA